MAENYAATANPSMWRDGPMDRGEAVRSPGALSMLEGLHQQVEANSELLQRLYEQLDLVPPNTDVPRPDSGVKQAHPNDIAQQLIVSSAAVGVRLDQHRVLLAHLVQFAERLR